MPTSQDGAGASWVPRERLLASLVGSVRPITVISGAAGSGKSTLVEQWFERERDAQATIRLTQTHDDPALLVRDIAKGTDPLGRGARSLARTATATEPAFSSTVLPAITALMSSRRRPLNLAIDDIHLLTKPKCHQVISSLAAAVPDGSRLVLVTREGPPDWLARLRSQGAVQDVTSEELDFDLVEARSLFVGLGVELGDEEAARIVAHCEGWAVGLYFTALAMQGNRPVIPREPLAAARMSQRYVLDYVRTQVLDEVDEAQRRFLLETSILHELRPSLCATVTDDPAAPAILADLQTRLQLVHPRSGSTPARYHHLLGQALHDELLRVEPSLVPRLHERAATWYQDAGQVDSAIAHAKSAGDHARAGALIWSRLIDCVASGHPDRLESWLQGLTREEIAGDRWLSLAAAWLAMQTADTVGILRWTLHCEAFGEADWRARAATDEYAAALAVLRALIGDEGLDTMISMADLAYRGLPPDNGFRAAAAFLWGVALTLKGDRTSGIERLRIAEQLGRALDAPVLIADSLSWRGILAILDGDTEAGLGMIQDAYVVVAEFDLDRLATSVFSITARALELAIHGSKSEARTTLGTARRMMTITEAAAPWFAVCGRALQARTAMLIGEGALARTLIEEARAHMTSDLEETLASTLLSTAEELLHAVRAEGISAGSLTTAELKVLQFLPSHLTFPQIGEHMFLSTNTIKTHALSIYRKLGVTSRADAVDRARALGLVEAPLVG